jgi:hypothetical protein
VVRTTQAEEIAETNPAELSEVLNLYRSQLRINTQGTLEEIKEVSRDSTPTQASTTAPTTFSPPPDRAVSLRHQCIATLGEDKFTEVYDFMRNHRRRGTEDDRVRLIQILKEAKERFGRNATNYCLLIDQLLFKEGI